MNVEEQPAESLVKAECGRRVIYTLTGNGNTFILKRYEGTITEEAYMFCCKGDPVPLAISDAIEILQDPTITLVEIIDMIKD